MWYIITIEPHEFLKLKVEQDEVNFEFQGKDNGIPKFNVSEGDKQYSIEVYEESYEPIYLNEIYKLNPAGFTCINHATILLKWNDDTVKLNNSIKSILYPKDKYAIFKVSEAIASNYLPVDYLNSQLSKSTVSKSP